jgi:hypothetical protein
MVKPAMRSAIGLLLLCTVACPGPPWALQQSPADIVLRWYPNDTPFAVADAAARLHCGSYDRTAELASDERDGSAEIATYRCR